MHDADRSADKVILVVLIATLAVYSFDMTSFEDTVVMLLAVIAVVGVNIPYRLEGD